MSIAAHPFVSFSTLDLPLLDGLRFLISRRRTPPHHFSISKFIRSHATFDSLGCPFILFRQSVRPDSLASPTFLAIGLPLVILILSSACASRFNTHGALILSEYDLPACIYPGIRSTELYLDSWSPIYGFASWSLISRICIAFILARTRIFFP
jgi:hypothetical protein